MKGLKELLDMLLYIEPLLTMYDICEVHIYTKNILTLCVCQRRLHLMVEITSGHQLSKRAIWNRSFPHGGPFLISHFSSYKLLYFASNNHGEESNTKFYNCSTYAVLFEKSVVFWCWPVAHSHKIKNRPTDSRQYIIKSVRRLDRRLCS